MQGASRLSSNGVYKMHSPRQNNLYLKEQQNSKQRKSSSLLKKNTGIKSKALKHKNDGMRKSI